jgi:hypothetical protein
LKTGKRIFFVVAAFGISAALAATTSIGVATGRGNFVVDDTQVSGTATIFNGSTLETGAAASDVRLQEGIDLTLASKSRGTIYNDHLVVEKGVGRVIANRQYTVEAGSLRITAMDRNALGIVAVQGKNQVQVEAQSGSWNVTRDGVLLARVIPGRALAFTLQDSGATTPITVTGVVSVDSGHYIITASDTGTRYELTGQNFDSLVGKTATVTGTPDPSKTPFGGASSVLVVSSSKVGAAAAAGTAGAAAGGLSTGATVAIIGAVAGAATIGGLAAAGTFSGASSQ